MKESLSCSACERELVALIDGTLTPSVARVVEGHARSCASCGAVLEDFHRIALGLRRMALLPAPARLEDRVVRELLGARRFLNTGLQRFGAALGAVSFVLTVWILAGLPRIAKALGIPDPYVWLVTAIDASVSALASGSKWLANQITLYVPIANQIWLAMEALKAIPRAVFVSLKTPEVQVAGAVLITLGLALYVILKPSRRHEGSVGHVCLSL